MQTIKPKPKPLIDELWIDDVTQQDPARAEKSLICAVLERAIADILAPLYDVGLCDKRAAFRWIWENNERSDIRELEPFTYGWICQHLNLDPVRIKLEIVRRMDAQEAYERPLNLCSHRSKPRHRGRYPRWHHPKAHLNGGPPLSRKKKDEAF